MVRRPRRGAAPVDARVGKASSLGTTVLAGLDADRAVDAARCFSLARRAGACRRGALPVRRRSRERAPRVDARRSRRRSTCSPSTNPTSPRAFPRRSRDRYPCCAPCSSISTTPCSRKPTGSTGAWRAVARARRRVGHPPRGVRARAEVDRGGGQRPRPDHRPRPWRVSVAPTSRSHRSSTRSTRTRPRSSTRTPVWSTALDGARRAVPARSRHRRRPAGQRAKLRALGLDRAFDVVVSATSSAASTASPTRCRSSPRSSSSASTQATRCSSATAPTRTSAVAAGRRHAGHPGADRRARLRVVRPAGSGRRRQCRRRVQSPARCDDAERLAPRVDQTEAMTSRTSTVLNVIPSGALGSGGWPTSNRSARARASASVSKTTTETPRPFFGSSQ